VIKEEANKYLKDKRVDVTTGVIDEEELRIYSPYFERG
jgi:hypothetical protein